MRLNKVNELDDKIVRATTLEMETDGGGKKRKKKENVSGHVGEFTRQGEDKRQSEEGREEETVMKTRRIERLNV